jgi:hypothetical protein
VRFRRVTLAEGHAARREEAAWIDSAIDG